MNSLKYITLALAIGLGSVSCTKENTEGEGLYAGKNSTTYVSSDSGILEFEIQTEGSWSASPVNSTTKTWTSFEGPSQGQGKATLSIQYRANNTFSREGRIAVKLGEARIADTIVIRQYGLTPTIEFRETTAKVYPIGGKTIFKIATNLSGSLLERIRFSMANLEGSDKEWISEGEVSNNGEIASCEISANQETDRKADLSISFTDDWGIVHSTTCEVSQVSMGNPEPMNFEQVRALAAQAPADIDKNCIITGRVVSSRQGLNNANNPHTSQTAIDYTANERTVYIQDTVGKFGFMIVYEDADQNTLNRYDRVTLSLKGAHLIKLDNPERYTITKLTKDAIFGLENGEAADLPVKEKYINELTANDLYTYVTLKDCEFPVRKGSYTPLNEGYTPAYNAHRISMYPVAVRDSKGNHIFSLTNMLAPWRRNGIAPPQGSGKLSGVVVNESYQRFDNDSDLGTFQIRAIEQSDIALANEVSKSYSKIIAAWVSKPTITNGVAQASIGTGTLSHTSTTAITTANDYSPLLSTDNKGVSSGTAWKNNNWWDADNNSGQSWLVKISTAGISAKHVALTFSVINQHLGAPRYWAVEWSEHGEKLGIWNRVAEYTVPDLGQWGSTLYSQLPGHKSISMELPTEVLGKANLYIRLIPTSTKAGTSSDYDSGTYTSSKESHMAYLAIQYND